MVRAAESQMSALASKLGLAGQAPPSAGAAAAAAVRDPRAAAPPAAIGGLLARGSPAMGESLHGVQQGWPQDELPTSAQRPARAAEVDVIAASGGTRPRPGLKRDRSKNYTEANKRHEALLGLGLEPAQEPAPASSDSSMQASQGGTPRGQPLPADSASSGGAAAGGAAAGGDAAQRGSIMQRTKAALQLWKALRVSAWPCHFKGRTHVGCWPAGRCRMMQRSLRCASPACASPACAQCACCKMSHTPGGRLTFRPPMLLPCAVQRLKPINHRPPTPERLVKRPCRTACKAKQPLLPQTAKVVPSLPAAGGTYF